MQMLEQDYSRIDDEYLASLAQQREERIRTEDMIENSERHQQFKKYMDGFEDWLISNKQSDNFEDDENRLAESLIADQIEFAS